MASVQLAGHGRHRNSGQVQAQSECLYGYHVIIIIVFCIPTSRGTKIRMTTVERVYLELYSLIIVFIV